MREVRLSRVVFVSLTRLAIVAGGGQDEARVRRADDQDAWRGFQDSGGEGASDGSGAALEAGVSDAGDALCVVAATLSCDFFGGQVQAEQMSNEELRIRLETLQVTRASACCERAA